MYAQCPNCLTFFHLKPSHLKAANGRVRCSRCKHVFNALETLRDELAPEEIAAVEAARRREPIPDAPLLNEEYAGDLFDGLDYTQNEELGFTADGGEGEPPEMTEREVPLGPLAAPLREFPGFAPPPPRKRHVLLLTAGNALLLLALAVQVIHWQRLEILEHPLAGPYLARAYAALGMAPEPPRDLAALHVSRTRVSSHPDYPRALHMTAVIENAGDDAQPWPELHVNLQDRWGETIAARYFTPAEYLREPSKANAPLPAHSRHAIELAIVDPGSAAVGFQVEPCFTRDERRVCAADINAAN
ncbi:MAG TPA: DUF3426 domain-containing protein [Gammaproteobacteria bacterium]